MDQKVLNIVRNFRRIFLACNEIIRWDSKNAKLNEITVAVRIWFCHSKLERYTFRKMQFSFKFPWYCLTAHLSRWKVCYQMTFHNPFAQLALISQRTYVLNRWELRNDLVRLRLYVLAQTLCTKNHLPLAFNSSHIAITQAKAGLFTWKNERYFKSS